MKRLITFALLALASMPVAAREPRTHLRPAANPSAVIARELEFSQAAQDKGQWTAFREFAAKDAVMFVPQMVLAQGWLKDRPNPPVAVRWQPQEVWSSCDGSTVSFRMSRSFETSRTSISRATAIPNDCKALVYRRICFLS